MVDLDKSNVAIAMHAYTPPNGLVLELQDYLSRHGACVELLVHPFPSARMPLHSTLQVIDHGKSVREFKTFSPKGPSFVFYLLDILFTAYLVGRARSRVDLFIGLDNLNALAGIVLRKLRMVDTVVFYVIDYVPQRFAKRRLNDLYHWIDRFCCLHADAIWNVSAAMMQARYAKWGTLDGCAPSLVVPWGCQFDRIQRFPVQEINRHDVVFLGSLLPEQGINLLLEIWPAILNQVPDANLVIVGGGGQLPALKAQVQLLGIAPRVRFVGFVQDDLKIESILSRCAVGVAPYRPDVDSFKYYCDPSKVKTYLGAGLPVVITRVPPIAQEIHDKQAGFTIDYDACELTESILRLLTDDDLYARYRANAIQFASEFTWDKIFQAALSGTLEVTASDNGEIRGKN